jgi:malonyl-CoA O-methyltransferase
VARLAGCAPREVFDQGVRLRHPVSPHLAAQLAGEAISVDSVFAQVGAAADAGASMLELPGRTGEDGTTRGRTFWIVEGAGGVLVPLNDEELMVDLMIQLGLPAVVVSRTSIGTINHTLLTLDLLGRRGVNVAAVVMSGPPDAAAREAIERHGRVFVAELPVLEPLDPAAVAAWAEGVTWPI